MSSSLFARFVTLYYAHLAPDDAKSCPPEDLEGSARAHLRFAEERPGGEPLVRFYTPTFDQDGFDSTHTIIEIVTDDMPFLVDSVGMELTGHGLGIHLVVHPIIGVRRDADGHLVDLDETVHARRSCTSRSTVRPTRRSWPRSGPTCCGCSPTYATPSTTGRRCGIARAPPLPR